MRALPRHRPTQVTEALEKKAGEGSKDLKKKMQARACTACALRVCICTAHASLPPMAGPSPSCPPRRTHTRMHPHTAAFSQQAQHPECPCPE